MYWLFSQTNTTGGFQTAAMLSASWNAPMFVVPSPKKQTATWPDLRYCADHAAPSAIGRCAPTIAYEPITPCSTLVRCIEPPLPPSSPVAAAEQLGQDRRHRHAPGEGVVVAAVRAERVVVGAHRRREAGRDRLLADARWVVPRTRPSKKSSWARDLE